MSGGRLKVGICDDEAQDLERMHQTLCHCMEILEEKEFEVFLFRKAGELLEESRKHAFSLIFLDVMMPEWSGFDLASQLGLGRGETKVVFVSNHESMVFDSYDYSPLWFVRKSKLEKDMLRALQKYEQITARKKISYRIKNGFKSYDVRLDELMYIECEGHTMKIQTSDGNTYSVYGSLRPVEMELAKYGFIRIHKNYLVNLRYVKEVSKKNVRLRDGSELDMGRARRKEMEEAMSRYERRSLT